MLNKYISCFPVATACQLSVPRKKGKAMEIRRSWAKLFDARTNNFLAHPFDCLAVGLSVYLSDDGDAVEFSCPQKMCCCCCRFWWLRVQMFIGFKGIPRLPVRQFGRFGVCHNTALPRLHRKRHLNATCVQDPGFVNFQPRGLKGGTPPRLIEYAHYGIPS